MTIRRHIEVKEFAGRLEQLEACAENAPEGCYEREKAIVALVGELTDILIRRTRAMGLEGPNCDQAREVEIALYAYIAEANPMAAAAGEGFGDSMDKPHRERVIEQARESRDALAAASRKGAHHEL